MAATGAPIRVPVAVACRVLGLSRQGYDKWLADPVSQRDRDDAHVIDALLDLHEDDPTLGYRFLTDELRDVDITASENREWRFCSTAGVFAPHHRRRGKGGKPGPPVHDDLLGVVDEHGPVTHEFTAGAPNEVWLTDIERHEAFPNPCGGERTLPDVCRSRRLTLKDGWLLPWVAPPRRPEADGHPHVFGTEVAFVSVR